MSTFGISSIDSSQPGVRLHRLVRVEMRKLIDTRAGFWLLALIVITSAIVVTTLVLLALRNGEVMSWGLLLTAINLPLGLLIPVFGIMTVTSEWGQRTALVTFTLEPRRHRTVVAKLLAGSILTIAAVLASMAISAGANVFCDLVGDAGIMWDVSARDLMLFAVVHLSGFALGFGFGMVIPNTPAAIVVFFVFRYVVPGLLAWAAAVWSWFEPIFPWINWLRALDLVESGSLNGEEFAQVLTAFGLWIVLPVLAGGIVLSRREVK